MYISASLSRRSALGRAVGLLTASDGVASVAAGVAIDRGFARVTLASGLLAFCAALALVQLELLPLTADARHPGGRRLPWSGYAAAALMGCGNGVATTSALSRLGTLADGAAQGGGAAPIPRASAFQYFQLVNAGVASLAFCLAPYWKLEVGSPPLQIATLSVLAACGGACAILNGLGAPPSHHRMEVTPQA